MAASGATPGNAVNTALSSYTTRAAAVVVGASVAISAHASVNKRNFFI
jgi:hypothetical protein